jgi:putative Mg2+ transporter-C (MgtC) family protein
MLIELKILGLVVIGAVLSGIIGFDRELADKPAGLRTHMVVGATSTLLISLTNLILPNLEINIEVVRTDPIRMIEALVAGITFLGAGTIIRHKSNIKGLTTAASLLFVAALGVTVGLEQFVLAAGLTLLHLVILRGIKFLEQHTMQEKQ